MTADTTEFNSSPFAWARWSTAGLGPDIMIGSVRPEGEGWFSVHARFDDMPPLPSPAEAHGDLIAAAKRVIAQGGAAWFNEQQLADENGLGLDNTEAAFIALCSPAAVLAALESQAQPKGMPASKEPHNGNDKEPRDPESYPYLDARGDDRGQGLDSYWKWGYAAGWNDHKKHAAQAPAPAPVTRKYSVVYQGASEMAHLEVVGAYEDSAATVLTVNIPSPAVVDGELTEAQIERAWRLGWRACRDAEFVGSGAEDAAWGERAADAVACVRAIRDSAQAFPTTASEFTNELGNAIRITIEGPTSTSENVLTPMEVAELRGALNKHARSTHVPVQHKEQP